MNTSDAKVSWSERYKPGGTASIFTSTMNAQTSEKNNDNPMGRWNAVTLGPTNLKKTIITAYIPCRTQIHSTKEKRQHTNSG